MDQRLKVLLSAYACEPGKGSESAGGWNWVQQMARFHEVWLVTRSNNRERIEKDPFAKNANVHWIYYDLPKALRFWKRGSRGIQLYYYLWQVGSYFAVRRLHRQNRFDLLHHVTLVKYWTPSFLGFLDAPAIFGPVGGGESAPASFYRTLGFRGRWFERLRDLSRFLMEHDPLTRAAVRRMAAVFATTDQTLERLQKMRAPNVSVRMSFAMTPAEIAEFAALPPKPDGPFRLISIGRLLPWKGFHLGLQAFAQFHRRCPDSEFWIVNTGPDMDRLRRLAAELGVQDKVVFWGKLPTLADVYAKLAQSDVLVHPSLHDSFGNVCLEAMATGRPVICLDLGGPGMQITAECGFKVHPGSPEQAVAEMAAAMEALQRNPALRASMAEHGRRRVREFFVWDRKGKEMNRTYQETVSQTDKHSRAGDKM